MARVQLDSGLDSLTGRGSKRGDSKRSSSIRSNTSKSIIRGNTSKSSVESSIRSNTSKSIIRGNTSKSSKSSIWSNTRESSISYSGDSSVNVGNNVSWKTSKQTSTTKSIWDGKSSRENSLLFLSLTLLSLLNNSLNNLLNSLLRGGSSGSSSSVPGSLPFSPGCLNFSSFFNSNKRGNSESTGGNGKIGCRHSESVDGVGNILNSLKETISINVLITSSGHTVGIPGLCASRWTTGMTKRELSELILSMKLGRWSSNW